MSHLKQIQNLKLFKLKRLKKLQVASTRVQVILSAKYGIQLRGRLSTTSDRPVIGPQSSDCQIGSESISRFTNVNY